jgi:glucose-1-phosphate thymidylyltransferase
MWGIVPAAGRGSRIQPLGFSKELLPVGTNPHGNGDRPCAVSEYLVERMVVAGVDKLCFVIAPGKSDIIEYFGQYGRSNTAYVVQPRASGLCDAIFRAEPLIAPTEHVIIGLPDTIWFPDDALCRLPDGVLSFLLFPVEQPALFDAVVTDAQDCVKEVQVKQQDAASKWIWGAFKMPGAVYLELADLWRQRLQQDEYIGTLVNAYLQKGGRALGIKSGEAYVDVGTLEGYRGALRLLEKMRGGASSTLLATEASGVDRVAAQ